MKALIPHTDSDKTTVELDLTTVNSHAIAIVGAFVKAGRRQGFNADWLESIRVKAMNGDYNHLLGTVMDNVHDPE